MVPEAVNRQTVIDGALPVQPGQRFALGIRNGNDGHFPELLVERRQVGYIQSAMQRRQGGNVLMSTSRIVQIIDVKVNQVEIVNLLEHAFHQEQVMGQGIDTVWRQPQRLSAGRHQPRFSVSESPLAKRVTS